MLYRSISPENQYFVLSLYLLHPSLSRDWDHTDRMYMTVLNAASLSGPRDKLLAGSKIRELPLLQLLFNIAVLNEGNITMSNDPVVLYIRNKKKEVVVVLILGENYKGKR